MAQKERERMVERLGKTGVGDRRRQAVRIELLLRGQRLGQAVGKRLQQDGAVIVVIPLEARDVLVDADRYRIIRRRESYDDLLAAERL